MKQRTLRWIALVVLVVMVATLGGCYGSFVLVQKVHKFNGTLGNKFVNELGFIVMNIVPVYSVAAFVDAVVLNTIEFWTGQNPARASNDTVIPLDDKNSLTLRGSDKSVVLTSKTDTGTIEYVFEKSDNGTLVKDPSGKLLARCVMTDDGGMQVFDGSGGFVAECSAARVAELAQRTQ